MKFLNLDCHTDYKSSFRDYGNNSNTFCISRLNDFNNKLNHTLYALKFPIVGKEVYSINNKEYHVDDHSYLVSNPGDEIEAYVKSKNVVVGVCIGFTKEYFSELISSVDQKLEKCLDKPYSTDWSMKYFSLKNRINDDDLSEAISTIKKDVLSNKIDHYTTDEFFMNLGQKIILKELKINSDIDRLPHIKVSSKQEIYRRISLMNDYIYDNYKKDVTLEDLSRVSMLSKFHALRCYQKINNITPYRKIISLRLKEATRLLEQGVKISEVATRTNFSDYRSFSKLFKAHFKMTPSQYTSRFS